MPNNNDQYFGGSIFFNGDVTTYGKLFILGSINFPPESELVAKKLTVTDVLKVGSGITVSNSGIITATGGFISSPNSMGVQITISNNRIFFSVVGLGSTSFLLI